MNMRSRRARPRQKGSGATAIAVVAVAIVGAVGYMIMMPAPSSRETVPPESTIRERPAAAIGRGKAPTQRAPATPKPAPIAAEMPQGVTDIPIWIELEEPQLVTVVIEDAEGKRVRNVFAELSLPAGRHRLSWDGYDDGQRNAAGDLVRNRVAAGTYRARGLTHDGLTLVYEFTVYSGGNPPWPTPDKTGGWLADHSCPLGAVFLPADSGSPYGDGQAQVLLTSLVAEAGAPLVWIGLDGRTLQRRQDVFGWDGAIAATRDAGAGADPAIYAYLVIASEESIRIRGLKKAGGGSDIVSYKLKNRGPEPRTAGYSLAVHDGLLVFNAVSDDELVFADARARTVLGTVPMAKPRGLFFERDGRLLAISSGKVLRYTVKRQEPAPGGSPDVPSLSKSKLLIDRGLEDPRTLAFNPAGTELYVADWGRSHQVKVFTPAGKLLRTIGKPGDGSQLGLYDERQMQAPLGLAIDDRDQLWVVEATHLPKRISLWNATTGAFVRANYGPPRYGGGGTIDPADKTRLFYRDWYGLMEFALDWKAGTAKPKAICVNGWADGTSPVDKYGIEYSLDGPSRWNFANERPVHVGGRTYLINSWQGELRGNDSGVIWLLGDDHIARPVARIGGAGFSWPPEINQAYWGLRPRKGRNTGQELIAWSDLNGNHKVDADEYTIRDMPGTFTDASGETKSVHGFVNESVFGDLSMACNWAVHVPAPTIDAKGIPIYDLAKATFLLPHDPIFYFDEQHHWGQTVLPMSEGWIVAGFTGWKDGRKMWSYPTTEAVPMQGGTVNHPTRLLGPPITAANGEAGDWFAVNGEHGNIFLMTADGLYLQTLGGDMRNTPLLRLKEATRGMVVDAPGNHISFEDEHFHPTITQTELGEVYLVAGKEHSSVFRVTGLSSVRRRDFEQVVLDAAMLSQLPEQVTIPARTKSSGRLLVGVGGTNPTVDGAVDEYAGWVPIGIGEGRSSAVHIGAEKLYAAWRTGDPDCLDNAGGDYRFLFKRGGCVDLMIQTDLEAGARGRDPIAGDIRLLVTTVNGATKAVLYRPVVPGTAPEDRVRFESPIGSATFDAVVDVSEHVILSQAGGDVEISVPLAVLGLAPIVGRETRADMGLLRGDGSQTIQRLYWSNSDTLLVSDIPSEARFQPANWGTWQFARAVPAEPRPAVTPEATRPGLRYDYHVGRWERLPDFAALEPSASGVAELPQLAAVEGLGQYFGLEFTGFVRVPSEGVWTFTLNSDDGSRLWIGDTLVADNDGQHAPQDVAGRIRLAAGLHPIRIGYFESGGGKTLQIRWSGPGTQNQALPATVLVHGP